MSTSPERVNEHPSDRDHSLLKEARRGNDEALQALLDRWRPLVSAMCAPRSTPGAERDHLLEEGKIGLFTAIRDYDMSTGIHFTAFLERCVSRQIRAAANRAAASASAT